MKQGKHPVVKTMEGYEKNAAKVKRFPLYEIIFWSFFIPGVLLSFLVYFISDNGFQTFTSIFAIAQYLISSLFISYGVKSFIEEDSTIIPFLPLWAVRFEESWSLRLSGLSAKIAATITIFFSLYYYVMMVLEVIKG